MQFNYKMPDIDHQLFTISITMTVNEWRLLMRNDNKKVLNMVSQALGDVARLSEQKYELPRDEFGALSK